MKTDRISSKTGEGKSNHQKNQGPPQSIRRRYADFFDFAPVGYYTFNREGLILNVNPNGASILGADKPSLLNQDFSHFLSPDSKKVFAQHSQALFASRQKKICDVKLGNGNQDGHWIQLESVAAHNGGDSKEKFWTVIKEVTNRKQQESALRKNRDELERRVAKRTAELEATNKKLRHQVIDCKMAEEALRESEQKYSTLVEDALIGVYIIKDGKIRFANEKFAEIYGYLKSEMIGMDSLDLVHPKDRPFIAEMRKKRLNSEKVPSEYEVRGLKKNGKTIWVNRSLSLINYKGGPAISGIVSDMTKRRKAENALRESGKELRILSNQLLSAEEKERKRIARELHDGIGQALSAIKFSVENSLGQLRKISDQSTLESLKMIIPLTQKTIEEVRTIVKDLRPSILDDLGILATINWFCREFQKVYTGIRIEMEIDVQENIIPSSLKTVIYRILQEALNNVAKHSRADLVQLSLLEKNNRIIMSIKDNGVGFDVSKTISLKPSRRGFGLTSMRERAGLSGADFDVFSGAGQGTTVRVVWDVYTISEAKSLIDKIENFID
jgi:PAS domain S-box-containing protein